MRFKRGARKRRIHLKRKRSYRKRRNGSSFKRRVRRAVQSFADHKYKDGLNVTSTFSNATAPYILTPSIVAGTGESDRVGNNINVRNLKIRFHFHGNSLGTQIHRCRIIVGCWTDYYSVAPQDTDFYQTLTNQDLTPLLRPNLEAHRWKPMYDRTFLLGNVDDDSIPADKYMFLNFHGKNLPGKHLSYNSGGSPNNVYFFCIKNQDSVNFPTYTFCSRFTWTDV